MNKEEIIRIILDQDTPEEKISIVSQVLTEGPAEEARVGTYSGYLNTRDACSYLGGISRVTLWHSENFYKKKCIVS